MTDLDIYLENLLPVSTLKKKFCLLLTYILFYILSYVGDPVWFWRKSIQRQAENICG